MITILPLSPSLLFVYLFDQILEDFLRRVPLQLHCIRKNPGHYKRFWVQRYLLRLLESKQSCFFPNFCYQVLNELFSFGVGTYLFNSPDDAVLGKHILVRHYDSNVVAP